MHSITTADSRSRRKGWLKAFTGWSGSEISVTLPGVSVILLRLSYTAARMLIAMIARSMYMPSRVMSWRAKPPRGAARLDPSALREA